MSKKKKPETDREKALEILHQATGDGVAQCAGRLTNGELNEMEIACLAHAYDGQSRNFAHEVINFASIRKSMEDIATQRVAAQVEKDLAKEPEKQPA